LPFFATGYDYLHQKILQSDCIEVKRICYNYNMSYTLITGAYGFMGRNLIDAWHTTQDLIGIDLPPELWNRSSLEPFHNLVPVYHYDLREEQYLVSEHLKYVDTVIHCANTARIQPSWEQYDDYYLNNITASHRLFVNCQKYGVKTFVYFSSSSVYGRSLYPRQQESDRLDPTNPYAVSKIAAEQALLVQAQRGTTRLIIVRPFTMYGDYMDYGKNGLVVARYLRAWMDREPLLLDGGGTQTRDFVHAHDAIRALALILEHAQHLDVFNIGSGKSVSIKQLADCVSNRQIISPERVGAVPHTCADISKLRRLGFEPQVDVLEWLTDQVNKLILKTLHNKETA